MIGYAIRVFEAYILAKTTAESTQYFINVTLLAASPLSHVMPSAEPDDARMISFIR